MAKFDRTLELAREGEFDVAVLDFNLGGTLSYPIAEVIRARGIPVIFATGYGTAGLLDKFRDCPTLQKPFSLSDFAQSVTAACALSQAMDRSPVHSRRPERTNCHSKPDLKADILRDRNSCPLMLGGVRPPLDDFADGPYRGLDWRSPFGLLFLRLLGFPIPMLFAVCHDLLLRHPEIVRNS